MTSAGTLLHVGSLALSLGLAISACGGDDAAPADNDGDGSAAGRDCNDEDPSVHPRADEVPYDGIDQDCDGADLTDVDGDGVDGTAVGGDDCDDDDAGVNPGADETPYDEVDQDCDGTDLKDVDGDTYDAVEAGGDDCDDSRADSHPSGVEVCMDTIDQDCSGMDLVCDDADLDMDGYSTNAFDCNDLDSSVNPGATETPYNGIDDDCDAGTPDDDLDGDGFRKLGGGDCDDMEASSFPGAAEIPYDGIDQDCSGSDERDVDDDGFEATAVGGDDCDDRRADVNASIAEIPHDGVDQDCNGSDFIGSPFEISPPASSTQVAPSLTWAGDRYLVVWGTFDGVDGAVHGRFVGAAGLPLGADLELATGVGLVTHTSVAYDGADGFLVSWEEGAGGIYGALLDTDGAPIGASFTIAGSGSAPRLAYGGGTYMMSFQTAMAVSAVVAVKTIDPDDGTRGIRVDLHTSAEITYLYQPSIAFDGTNFLVTWLRQINPWAPAGPDGTSGRFVDPAGAPVDIEFGLSDVAPELNYFTSNTNFLSTAFDGTNFLTVITADGSIFGQFTDPSGTPLFNPVDASFVVSNGVGYQGWAQSAIVEGAYVVVFRDNRWGVPALFVQRVAMDSSLLDTESYQNIPVVATDQAPDAPQIASSGPSALVVFTMDGVLNGEVFTP